MIYLLPFFVVFFLFLVITPGKLLNKPYVWLWETLIPKLQQKFSKPKEIEDEKGEKKIIETSFISNTLAIPLKMLGCLFCLCHWATAFALICIYIFGLAEFHGFIEIFKNFVYSGVVSTFIFRALMQQR